jgi:zinc D-Ala-D-Ala carboxypeptidase
VKRSTIAIVAVVAIVVAYVLWRGGRYAKERMNSPFKYFTWSEFDSPDQPGSGKQMNPEFIRKLDAIREAVGFPLIVNSGYRTPAHNAEVGGKSNSAHLRGYAADIRAFTDAQKRAIAKAAIAQGITRIGWARTYIHLDMDPTLPQRVVWNYGNASPSFTSLA